MARKKYTEIEQNIMKRIGFNLNKLLKERKFTQKDLSTMTGLASSTISDYINAKTLMSPGNLEIISYALQVNKSDIDDSLSKGNTEIKSIIMLPIVGQISCGNGMLAYEHIEGYEPTPVDWVKGGEYFYLRAKGDSMMSARIYDGDLLLIRKQEDVEDGQIAAVMIEDDVFLKRVYKRDGKIILQSENTFYPPIIINDEMKIIGKLKMNVIKY